MILLLDNYDSFTYNLYQYLGELYKDIVVFRNDQITCEDIEVLKPKAIVFSPGAGVPSNAGRMEEIIQRFYKCIPMLGICLGHQAIGEVFGGKIVLAKKKLHGEQSSIFIKEGCALFDNLSLYQYVGRYHSLVVEHMNEEVMVYARSEEDEIMAIKHKDYPVYGIQFHPESILTPCGKQILSNFLKGVGVC